MEDVIFGPSFPDAEMQQDCPLLEEGVAHAETQWAASFLCESTGLLLVCTGSN